MFTRKKTLENGGIFGGNTTGLTPGVSLGTAVVLQPSDSLFFLPKPLFPCLNLERGLSLCRAGKGEAAGPGLAGQAGVGMISFGAQESLIGRRKSRCN